MNEEMVKVEHVKKTFMDEGGAFDVLKDVSFTVSKGEIERP